MGSYLGEKLRFKGHSWEYACHSLEDSSFDLGGDGGDEGGDGGSGEGSGSGGNTWHGSCHWKDMGVMSKGERAEDVLEQKRFEEMKEEHDFFHFA